MAIRHLLIAAAVAAVSLGASAAGNSINLGRYQVSAVHGLDIETALGVSGLEASAVTYARDRGSLFFVGDEGTGVVEVSLTGKTLGSMKFDWNGTGSTNNDAEGLAYLGGGKLVVLDERPQRAYQFSYTNGGTAALASSPYATISNYTPSNFGLEGISYDARDQSFVSVKQDDDPRRPERGPQEIRSGSLSFAAGGGSSTMAPLFDAYTLGLNSLSDVQVLSGVSFLSGSAGADNLLVLSLDSRRLVEITRSGTILSSLDLSNILPHNGIEGVTVDEKGTIYLVAEQIQDGSSLELNPKSQLIVLTAPVPEPDTWAMMVMGLAGVAAFARRRTRTATRAAV